jgi:hypothetical protein
VTVLRAALLERLRIERERQFHLPGAEWDGKNTPNDWCAIAMHYLGEELRRGGIVPTRENFEDSLVKAGAVILAALEHAETMQAKKDLI